MLVMLEMGLLGGDGDLSWEAWGRTYTARVTANGEVTTSMNTVRVLHVILEPSNAVLIENRHGLVGGALLCEPALDIALEAARVVVEVVARAHVDLEPVSIALVSSQGLKVG
jgi:hypothetical protein